jgi:hypothetical protein
MTVGGRHLPAWAVVLAILAVGGSVAVLLGLRARPPDAVQPFPFNHRIHAAAKVDCLACHAGVVDTGDERLPSLAKCRSCHASMVGQPNPAKQQLKVLLASGAPLRWDPLLRLPEHVVFSHARHVDVAGLDCLDCHAEMVSLASPPRYERTMQMDSCIACHKRHHDNAAARRGTVNCTACHR